LPVQARAPDHVAPPATLVGLAAVAFWSQTPSMARSRRPARVVATALAPLAQEEQPVAVRPSARLNAAAAMAQRLVPLVRRFHAVRVSRAARPATLQAPLMWPAAWQPSVRVCAVAVVAVA